MKVWRRLRANYVYTTRRWRDRAAFFIVKRLLRYRVQDWTADVHEDTKNPHRTLRLTKILLVD